MASELSKWVTKELSVLMGSANEGLEDLTSYLLTIDEEEELITFVKELLFEGEDSSEVAIDGPKKEFIRELTNRWKKIRAPTSMIVLRRDDDLDKVKTSKPASNKLTKNQKKKKHNVFDMSSNQPIITENDHAEASGSGSSRSKKKTTYVSLYGKDGELHEKAVLLPGRHACDCQAQKHNLISNCMACGRIICDQEGSGPCLFCGALVCTREEKEILARQSRKSEKLLKKLNSIPGGGGENKENNALDKARQYKDRLLDYDRTHLKRTKIIDDESDYYNVDNNVWLNKSERELLKKKQAEEFEARHGSRLNKKITLDFAGRRVVEDDYSYNAADDKDLMDANFGSFTAASEKLSSNDNKTDFNSVSSMCHPSFQDAKPQFIPTTTTTKSSNNTKKTRSDDANMSSGKSMRILDREFQGISDYGQCLSMHQPWASLLVSGIKKDEGRNWYSNHRGRLWIASTVQVPSDEEVSIQVADHISSLNHVELDEISDIRVPEHYPQACLLGCVYVKDVLSQEDYRKQYPNGMSASPFVFVCENPMELKMKIPVKGQHKIWKLDPEIHKAARNALVY